MLKIAKETARQKKLQIKFYKQNIHNINLKTKYDKIFLFFSEFGLFDANNKVLSNISKILKTGGLSMLDYDNIFRLIQYLIKHKESEYRFDFNNMELIEKEKDNLRVRYYIAPELKNLFQNNGLKVVAIYGDYEKNSLDINSKRTILIGKKIKKRI